MASIQVSEEKGVRYLHFGSPWVQGAMRIARPAALELEYTRQMLLPLLLHDERWPATVLQIGLGSASLTRFLLRHRPGTRITVVEIWPQVVAAARQFFKLPEDHPRLDVVVDDGHEYLAGTRRRFDLLLVDAFDEKGRSGMIDSVPFYANCRARLARSGMASFNLLTRTRGAAPAIARIGEAFAAEMLALPVTEAGNLVVIAGHSLPLQPSLDELRTSAHTLKSDTGLDLLPTLSRL